ncbi:MAG: HAD family hydrolase [Nocardioidaceae bacterium]
MDASSPRLAAFFDLDKTIIAKSSALVFSRNFYASGLINRRSVVRSVYAQLVFLLGGTDHNQMEKLREFLSRLSAGWNVETVREIVADTLHNTVDPLVYDEALVLMRDHQAAGHDVIIVSASGSEIVEPIGQMLGVDDVIATKLEVADGRYTGVIEHYVYGEAKAAAITRLAVQRGYDLASCYAYSDSHTDLPMLKTVGHPTVVNPDKELRRAALESGWPILEFSRPVGLRSGVAVGKPALAVLGVVAAATISGLVWAACKRRAPESSTPA